MTSEEARARFNAAIDEELSADELGAFEAALARDSELNAAFERYQDMLTVTRSLGRDVVSVDLLSGVQQKLRARSGGRFYRDRFAEMGESRGVLVMVLLVSVCVVVGVLFWWALDAGWFAGSSGSLHSVDVEAK